MLSHPGRWHATVLLLLLGALGLLTVSSPSTAAALRSARESKSHPTEVSARNTVYLANGTGDGTASVYVDPFGQFSTLYYNPVGPTGSADTTYYSSVWFSGAGRAGVGNQGRWLSSSYIPKVTFTVQEPSRAVSQWTSDNLSFQLEQELQPTNGRGSTLRQVYRITNPGTVGTNFDLIRHVDGDLSFDGSIRDLAGVSQSRQLLYEFDSGDNPSALTTFVGIDLNRNANLGFQIAPYSYTGTISQLGRGALKNQVAGDLDADGVTDSPYDVTMSLGQTFTVPPGVTISFVTNTVLGEGTAGLVPEAFRVIPRSGGVGGTVSATISGASFVPGAATVRLKGEGQSPITGTETRVLSANTLRTTFDLTGAAVGPRDVEVVFSDGNVLTLSQAFTVEPHARPELWVDVTGRGAIRVGREQTFTVLYGNRGNADAMAVPLWLTGIPEGSTYRLDSELRHPPQRAGAPTVNWDQFPIGVLEGNSVSVPLLLGFVPAGETGSLRITITLPAAQTFRLGARISQPFIDAATAPALMRALRTKQSPAARRQALQALAVQAAATSSASGCGLAIVNELLNLAGIFPGFSCANSMRVWFFNLFQEVVGLAVDSWRGTVDVAATHWSFTELEIDLVLTAADCAGHSIPVIGTLWSLWGAAKGAVEVAEECGFLDSPEDESLLEVITVASFDPNDKVGALGTGPQRYISGSEPLRYTVFFENMETATAAAQEVVVTDQLDLSVLDPATFSLGAIQFGPYVITPEPGQSEWTTTVDLRPQQPLKVRVEARLDPFTGVLSWRFTSLDPVTGLPTDDPFLGFLPPNHTPPEGDGSVSFTIQPRSLESGAVIANQARIYFDTNAPIDTPVWSNTVDFVRPSSGIQPLSSSQSSNVIPLTWSGSDDVSGVKDYTIYVSTDGGAYAPWLLHTSAGSGQFPGEFGHRYMFYSVAQDQAGNLEAVPDSPDAQTTVAGSIDALIAKLNQLKGQGLVQATSAKKLLTTLNNAKKKVVKRLPLKAAALIQGKFLTDLTKEERKARVTPAAASELRALAQVVIAALNAPSSGARVAVSPGCCPGLGAR